MSRRTALFNAKSWIGAAVALLSGMGCGTAAQAQNLVPPATVTPLPDFNGLDWLTDRGGPLPNYDVNFNVNTIFGFNTGVIGTYQGQQRPGFNNYGDRSDSPDRAKIRWTFPFSYELPGYTGKNAIANPVVSIVTVDNPNAKYPNKPYAYPSTYTGLAHSYFIDAGVNVWKIPSGQVPGLESYGEQGGLPFPGTTSADAYYGDYGYIYAVHSDFSAANQQQFNAFRANLNALPNANPTTYDTLNKALLNTKLPAAVWTGGLQTAGRYKIQLYSPGAGLTDTTKTTYVTTPNVSRAFVRVSWGAGTTPGGAPNINTLNSAVNPINNNVTSRIFMVDLTTKGWITLGALDSQGVELNDATFPFDGLNNDQLTVTLYALTPDGSFGTDGKNVTASNGKLETITADAVRFTLTQATDTTTYPGLKLTQTDGTDVLNPDGKAAYISSTGSIYGGAIGTDKLPSVAGATKEPEPLIFFARNEPISNSILTPTYTDPTNANSGAVADPTQSNATVPVFYCINNRSGSDPNLASAPLPPYLESNIKVRWRFVASQDSSIGRSYGSPALANVRCRDGIIRPMVYFTTTTTELEITRDANNILVKTPVTRAHIYALDPLGDLDSHSTTAYWEYPTAPRGVANADGTNANDPNVQGTTPDAAYNAAALNGFGTGATLDQNIAGPLAPNSDLNRVFDIYTNPYANTPTSGLIDVRRRIPFGGIKGSPVLMDDPSNPTGPQILVVASLDGHIYAFDAGGRGDFGNINKTFVPGSTQRLWTWPRLAVDKEYFYALTKIPLPAQLNEKASDILLPNDSQLPNFQFDRNGNPTVTLESFSQTPTVRDATDINSPIVIGSDIGHLFALSAKHEDFKAVTIIATSEQTLSQNLRNIPSGVQGGLPWIFPQEVAEKSRKLPLGPISAVTVYRPGNNLDDQYVFSVGGNRLRGDGSTTIGHVYSVYATRNGVLAPSSKMCWAYPEATLANIGDLTNNPRIDDSLDYNPALPDPNNAVANDDYNSAPVVLKGINFAPDATGANAGTVGKYDVCYALNSFGTLTAFGAQPSDVARRRVTLYGSGAVPGNTQCSPTALVIRSTPNLQAQIEVNNDTQYLTLVFGDLNGNVYALSATPQLRPDAAEAADPAAVTNYLPKVWQQANADFGLLSAPRTAPAIVIGGDLFNTARTSTASNPSAFGGGLLLQGDENGTMYCYGVGTGVSGNGDALTDIGPNSEAGLDGSVTIDIRGLDFFSQANYNGFIQDGEIGKAPVKNTLSPTNGANGPLKANLGANTNNGYAFEWGDSVYVAAWGVYHALPTVAVDPLVHEFGIARPTITVQFTLNTGPGRSQAITTTATLPGLIDNKGPNSYGAPGNTLVDPVTGQLALWPADTAANTNNLNIWGIDPNDPNQKANQVDAMGNLIKDANGQLYPLDPGVMTLKTNGNVYPWIAVMKLTGPNAIQIIPDSMHFYTPGNAGFRVTAVATITQPSASHPFVAGAGFDVTQTNQGEIKTDTATLVAGGQTDPDGKDKSFRQDPEPQYGRPTYIANPIALTTRGTNNVTGANNYNVIRWAATPSMLTLPGEAIGNGNRVVTDIIRYKVILKPLFAPMGAIENNTSGEYMGLSGGFKPTLQKALYITDRSNYWRATGQRLPVKASGAPLAWRGGASSVMNPLPWETPPIDGSGSADYPNLSSEAVHLVGPGGQDFAGANDDNAPTLDHPDYTGATPADNYAGRAIVPTPITLSVTIPKYFPANMNWGASSAAAAHIGAPFIDPVTGTVYGDPTQTLYRNIIGPLDMSSGKMIAETDGYAAPSGGFTGSVNFIAAVKTGSGSTTQQLRNDQGLATDPSGTVVRAYSSMAVGASVPATVRLRVDETTIDLGKLPHGGGYSDPDPNAPGGLRAPFAPEFAGSRWYTGGKFADGTTSPADYWDSATNGHNLFFHPFTVINESNVNLIDVRLAKLISKDKNMTVGLGSLYSPAATGYAQATQIQGADVNVFGTNGLFALSFPAAPGGVGSIGVASSIDHQSDNSSKYREISQFPVSSPYVYNGDIMAWNNDPSAPEFLKPNPYKRQLIPLGVQDAKNTAAYFWSNGLQPQATLHKPRPGDGTGTVLTVPDTPYGRSNGESKPLIGMAIPLGTPVGTYTAKIAVFEDNTPFQMQLWHTYSGQPIVAGVDHDGILNRYTVPLGNNNTSGEVPGEAVTEPGLNLKLTVTESRMTSGVTKGSLGVIDPVLDELDPAYDPKAPQSLNISLGSSLLPAAIPLPLNGNFDNGMRIALYMTTNRQPKNSGYLDTAGAQATYKPMLGTPWSLAYSALTLPIDTKSGFIDATFAVRGTVSGITTTGGYDTSERWWTSPTLFKGNPVGLATQFPSRPNVNAMGYAVPYLPGDPVPATERHGSPAIASDFGGNTYLFWQGTVDKNRPGPQATQLRDSRTFYQKLDAAGQPDPASPTLSFLNDPALTKLSPKPIIVTSAVNGSKRMFLFWHTGGRGQAALYYNVNSTPGFPASGWSRDTKLPVPQGLVWQSDPNPIYRGVIGITTFDPKTGAIGASTAECIDVVYTGSLKNRANAETLLSRYIIMVDKTTGAVTLETTTLPRVENEMALRVGATDTYETRDISWFGNNVSLTFALSYTRNGVNMGNLISGTGTSDTAARLNYFNSTLGGRVVLDQNTGRVSFPNVPLNPKTDRLFVSYYPEVIRLSVDRSDTGITTGDSSVVANTASSTYSPVAFLDSSKAGKDRLWVFYRKSDPTAGAAGSSLRYKTMRLMVRIPGFKTGTNIMVGKAAGQYETDQIRGIVFFSSGDEGNVVTVNGSDYRVAWRDELGSIDNLNQWHSTADKILPTENQVSEGQITAFKDPIQQKVWVFWMSSRNGTPDLYYETLSPQFDPFKLP